MTLRHVHLKRQAWCTDASHQIDFTLNETLRSATPLNEIVTARARKVFRSAPSTSLVPSVSNHIDANETCVHCKRKCLTALASPHRLLSHLRAAPRDHVVRASRQESGKGWKTKERRKRKRRRSETETSPKRRGIRRLGREEVASSWIHREQSHTFNEIT